MSTNGLVIPEALKCAVCTGPLPPNRAYARTRYTCSPECRKVLREFQRRVVDAKGCNVCGRPATPEERHEFRQWRKSKAQAKGMTGERGRPPVKRTKLLEDALRGAMAMIEEHSGNQDKLAEFQILLDAKAQSGSTLAPCGQTTETTEAVQGES